MATMRIISLTAPSVTEIIIRFTDSLSTFLTISNFTIVSETDGVPDPSILQLMISGNVASVTTQPLTGGAVYRLTCLSTDAQKFRNVNGDSFLFEDQRNNAVLFLGPDDPSEPIFNNFINYFSNNIYDTTSGTVINSYLRGYSSILSKALYDIRQLKNENYLRKTVIDEQKTRSSGPFDRLNEEGAFEVLRVGLNTTGTSATGSIAIDSFPRYLVSLQQDEVVGEIVKIDSTDGSDVLNVNTLVLTVANQFITKLHTVRFNYNYLLPNGQSYYNYDVTKYGYQILDPRYDEDFASINETLGNDQVKLSDKILSDVNFSLSGVSSISVNYQRKLPGRVIDGTTVVVTKILPATLETVDPLLNIFNLNQAPIVDATGNVPTKAGVTFLDPNANPALSKAHPAFLNELTFTFDYLPSKPGDYAVDYTSGTVYVYGNDARNNGTGEYPPLATYTYQHTFQSLIDYIYEPDTADIIALPNRQLIDNSASITFAFEDVLVPNVDYVADTHVEVLSENIGNNIIPLLNVVTVQNSPVTNVFRIFNQTQGQIYPVTRWSGNKIYFNSNGSNPTIDTITGERAVFRPILNEVLFTTKTMVNGSSILIYQIDLKNSNIMAATEDCVASSFNTSLVLSNSLVFVTEKYFDAEETLTINLNRLQSIGQYSVDYADGVVYVAVATSQDYDLGTASYRSPYVETQFPHITSPIDIYYRRNLLQPKDKSFAFQTFDDGYVLPQAFDIADEKSLNGNVAYPYISLGSQVGTFINAGFVPGVTNNVKALRSIYELNDLLNNPTPINFAQFSSAQDKTVTIGTSTQSTLQTVKASGPNKIVNTGLNLSYLSPNLTISFNVVRTSDSAVLWNGAGTYILGSPIVLILPGTGSPVVGDSVIVTVNLSVNDLSRIIIDYDKGDYYVDYQYLADEIIVSYEYGDNVLDFRKSNAVSADETYYVSYRVGALRDALLKNFGTLTNIPLLSVFDSTFERERYRDALRAALSSFIQGPTMGAMSNIVSTITHVAPTIEEAIFDNWSLGNSLLYRDGVSITGDPTIVKGVYDNGVLLDVPGQTLSFPAVGNFRLESGTFESWIIPQWNGIDNDAQLTFKIIKNNGYAPNMEIFIGAAEYHPTLTFNPSDSSYSFTVSKGDKISPFGRPNKKKNGIFIYLETDGYGQSASFDGYGLMLLDGYGEFTRWYVDVVNDAGNVYNFNIKTNGSYFDVKPFGTVDGYSSTASGTDTIYYTINGSPRAGIQFVADYNHYIYDYGDDKTGRFSFYKDSSGYLNFAATDQNGIRSIVSADVSYWKISDPHHVATSWILNSKDQHDEMHLFIDGVETPNTIRYGDTFPTLYGQKFRTLGTEEVVSVLTKNITAGNDLIAIAGQTLVTVGQNLSAAGINPGDTFYITTFGFNPTGYTVVNVSGNNATLSAPMPISITNASYTINKATISISTKASIAPNVTVSLLHASFGLNDGAVTTNSPVLTSSAQFRNIGIVPGDIVWIVNNATTNHFTIISVANGSFTLDRNVGVTASSAQYYVYSGAETELPGLRAMIPYYSISVDGYGNDTLVLTNGGIVGDIVRVRTLGLNSTLLTERFYQWGGSSNVIQTRMPPPIAINDVIVTKVLLPSTSIGPNNSTLAGGIFTSNAIVPDAPSLSDSGRTLNVSLYGVNVDFSTPSTVTIVGTSLSGAASETLNFTSSVTLSTVHKYKTVTSVVVTCKPVNPTFGAVAVEIKELYPITTQESSATYGVIRFSHQVKFSTTLSSNGTGTFTDASGVFSSLDVGNYIHIFSPPGAVGYYPIVSVSSDHKSCTITTSVTSFTNGTYEVLDATTSGSGVQNGMFIFEIPNQPGQPYNLTGGTYEFKYHSYLSVKYPPKSGNFYLASDGSGNGQLNAILDEVVIYNQKLTDVRIGETADTTYGSVTQHFNAPKAPVPTSDMLTLLHMDDNKFINEAPVYTNGTTGFVQSGRSVNSRFGESILVKDSGIVVDNKGILTTSGAGTVEFWVSPLIDAFNDPNYRYYFDAASVAVENVTSVGTNVVQISGNASQVASVNTQFGDTTVDYFLGGTISNGKIYLNKSLPYENTPVTVHYYPTGTNGDRISIFKDPSGFVVFNAHASGTDYQVRCPVFWRTGTWHRVKATWNFNGGKKTDTVRLFIDGFERGNVLYGQGLMYGQNVIYGQSFVGQSTIITTITFKDLMNKFTVGSDYNGKNSANALLDNVRISNVLRTGFTAFNQSIDVNYNANVSAAYPVTKDLYTTYLFDFDSSALLNTDFAKLRNAGYGDFDFSVNVLDSFGIVSSSDKVKQVLETLINTLKPANSRVFISYE